MTTLKVFLKDYFLVRKWFLHHVLLGLLIGLIVGAGVMWIVTTKYVSNSADAGKVVTGTTTTQR